VKDEEGEGEEAAAIQRMVATTAVEWVFAEPWRRT